MGLGFILFYVNFIKKLRIKKLNICNIPLSESEEYDIWMNSLDVWLIYGLTVYTKFLVLDFQANV